VCSATRATVASSSAPAPASQRSANSVDWACTGNWMPNVTDPSASLAPTLLLP
jgi:hypothetical protein